jgi:PEGA domain
LKILILFLASVCVAACSWFHPRPKPPPEPPELIVTGAPTGSTVFVDNVQVGQAAAANDKPQVLTVAPGDHTVEVRADGAVLYREQTYVGVAEKRVVRVLSGASRE